MKLPCVRGKTNKENVGPVVFNEGDIFITQKALGNRSTLRLSKSDYRLEEGRFSVGTAQEDEHGMFVGCFSVTGEMPACRIDTDKGDDESIALASAHPLASLLSTFRELRLVVEATGTRWKEDGGMIATSTNVLRGQLTQLCRGHSSANLESRKLIGSNRRAWNQPPFVLRNSDQAYLSKTN